MEVVSGIAAIAQLTDSASKIAGKALELYRTIHEAPVQLKELAEHLRFIRALLQDVDDHASNPDVDLHSNPFFSQVSLVLSSADKLVNELHEAHMKYTGTKQIRKCLEFGLKGSTKIEKRLLQLRHIEHGLNLLITTLQWHNQSVIVGKVDNLKDGQLVLVEKMDDLKNTFEEKMALINCAQPTKSRQSSLRNRDDVQRPLSQSSFVLGCFRVVNIQRAEYSDVAIYLRARLPLIDHVFQFHCCFRKHPLCGMVNLLPGPGLGFSRVIDDDSEFMIACQKGDLKNIRELCQAKKARPDDVSMGNMTPLLYAVQSGKVDAVKFLIAQGASVDLTGGKNNTSPIQWAIRHNHLDIVRELIEKKADLYYANHKLGWSPVYYCWAELQGNQSDRTEVLKILHEASYLDLDMEDSAGWTVFHRAAAFGTAEDVEVLLKMGAHLYTASQWLQWQAIQYAVSAGNWATFSTLLPKYGKAALKMTDQRGWTLLHIAADTQSRPIICQLLQEGASPDCLSWAVSDYVPREVAGKQCTPEDVAKALGPVQHELYLDELSEHQEIYWDAE